MDWRVKAINRAHVDFSSDLEKVWKEPFIFVQGADPQFGMFADYEKITSKPKWAQEIDLAELAIKKVNKMKPKPKFFVVCGDLCHTYYDESPEDRAAQEADFKRVFSKLDPTIPLVCICGNHDIGENPTVASINKYKSSFGDDYLSFHAGGVFFICINSQFYRGATNVMGLIKDQDQWLDSQLEIAKQSPTQTIMFQHVPWFVSDPYAVGNTDHEIELSTRKKMLKKLTKAGVKYVFSGHLHKNSGGKYEDLECVSTSAIGYQLGTDKSGLRVVRVYQDRVKHRYYGLSEVPAVVNL